MSFPVIQDADTKSNAETSGSTSHTITYCTNIAAGDLLIMADIIPNTGTISGWPTGWTQIAGGLTSPRIQVSYKIATGAETGTFALTTSDSELMSWVMYRITGWHGTSAPEVPATASGTSAAPDPASLTPSWGSADTLWLAYSFNRTGTISVSAYPTNYTNGANIRFNNTSGVGIGVARRNNTIATEDAGAFTLSGSDTWGATTVAVRPPAGVTYTSTPSGGFEFCGNASVSYSAPGSWNPSHYMTNIHHVIHSH